ncbi:MAG: LytTR family transcriptional regulator DNA-binding domain-containing protein [Firmicutes bacterium]|nr:LytTR family transcriptional regulator DNA-binding domain-containing protein [Bacillota bacterium]MDY5997208.1 LytTR family transcriptional regulator DNA-binding domain-containing protein [Erysipelotrichaceae bacterium]
MKIAIIDDDIRFLDFFEKLLIEKLSKIVDDLQILTYSDFRNVNFNSEVFFIDIQIQEDNDGFKYSEIIKKSNKKSIIIFISNHNNYVYDLFAFEPFDFYRKSNIVEDLNNKFNRLIDYYNRMHKYYNYSYKGTTLKIPLSNIITIESFSNNLVITTNTESYTERKKISSIDFLDKNFYKVNRSIIINFDYVVKAASEYFLLSNNRKIYLRKRFNKKALELYYNYLENNW